MVAMQSRDGVVTDELGRTAIQIDNTIVGWTTAPTALERVNAHNLADIDRSAPAPLIVGRISPNGHTILYGPGDSGKGVLACWWIAQHVLADVKNKVLILDFEGHPEEWARRLWGLGGFDMFADNPIKVVCPFEVREWTWTMLHDAAAEHEATLIVIDSVGYAVSGADPSEAKAATAYSASIQPFGVPVLSLAHMNRAGDTRYPFGSQFWHAGARYSWSLVTDGENGSKLYGRKHNNYPWGGAYMVTSDWLDGIPRNVSERSYAVTVAERIAEVLAAGPATVADIVAALNGEDQVGEPVKRNTVSHALRRGLTASPKVWTVVDDLWRLITPESTSSGGQDEGQDS